MSSTGAGASETLLDRKKQRELQEARQSGSVAPAVDVKTGQMINPHNPEFLTKRPWYLSNDAPEAAGGPSLDHQTSQFVKEELSLTEAEEALQAHRKQVKQQLQSGKFHKGQWVEALKKNKKPYRMCKIIKIHKGKNYYDLQYEDGTIETKVKAGSASSDRPRIRMTKTGNRSMMTDLAAKETFDSKRDAYHGYDKDSHNRKLQEKFEQREAIRRQIREEESKKKQASGSEGEDNKDGQAKKSKEALSDSDSDLDSDVEDDDSDDEFVQRDEDAKVITSRLARQGGVGGAQMKVTARNLRIREDTAKYLRNLDTNSAYYDPKSRSMRDNPNPEVAVDATDFAGDNFARISGDAVGLAETQLFAWDASDKGVSEVHPQANPSQAEILKKEFKAKTTDLKLQRKKAVLDKYGGQEYLDGTGGLASAVQQSMESGATTEDGDRKPSAVERKLRFGVSTAAEEYSRDGRLLKSGGVEIKQRAIESKYEEDVFINGHTTVWGSYFHKGAFQWGYADDHSLMKNSYCTGENGRIANDESNEMRYGTGKAGSAALAQARGMLKAMPGSDKSGSASLAAPINRSKFYGEADQAADVDSKKLQEALKRAEEEEKKKDEKKRKYNSMNADVDMTEEDMEAYRLRKERKSDPMANIGSDEVLDYK